MTEVENEIPSGHIRIVDTLLERYGLERIGIRNIEESVQNRNYRVETSDGPRFARIHAKRRGAERITREHRVAEWVAGHGLPAAAPLADGEGDTLHRIGGVYSSLFPWIDGRHVRPGAITAEEAATLGGLLGDLHVLLRGFDAGSLESGEAEVAWDTAESINQLARVDDLFRFSPSIPQGKLQIQKAVRKQIELLESGIAEPWTAFNDLPRQACHGDFHERNVLLGEDGAVAGVVDWELVSLLSPIDELVRSVALLGLLEAPLLLEAFVAPYRERVPLTAEECARGVEMRWQATLHDTWVYREVFIRGNGRAAQFLENQRVWIERFNTPSFREDLARRLAG